MANKHETTAAQSKANEYGVTMKAPLKAIDGNAEKSVIACDGEPTIYRWRWSYGEVCTGCGQTETERLDLDPKYETVPGCYAHMSTGAVAGDGRTPIWENGRIIGYK